MALLNYWRVDESSYHSSMYNHLSCLIIVSNSFHLPPTDINYQLSENKGLPMISYDKYR